MEWYVEISGNESDLEKIALACNSNELNISFLDKKYILKSSDFETLNSSTGIRKRAEEILALLTGAAKLAFGAHQPLSVDSVIQIGDDGKKISHHNLYSQVNVSGSCCTATKTVNGKIKRDNPADQIPFWFNKAQTDKNVAAALQLNGLPDPNWIILYMIMEIVESDIGGIDKIVEYGWSTKKQIKLFRRTAQLYRHSKIKIPTPPKNPMSISDAIFLVSKILRKWLHTKS